MFASTSFNLEILWAVACPAMIGDVWVDGPKRTGRLLFAAGRVERAGVDPDKPILCYKPISPRASASYGACDVSKELS